MLAYMPAPWIRHGYSLFITNMIVYWLWVFIMNNQNHIPAPAGSVMGSVMGHIRYLPVAWEVHPCWGPRNAPWPPCETKHGGRGASLEMEIYLKCGDKNLTFGKFVKFISYSHVYHVGNVDILMEIDHELYDHVLVTCEYSLSYCGSIW